MSMHRSLHASFRAILVILFLTTQNIGLWNKFRSKFENYFSERITRIKEIESELFLRFVSQNYGILGLASVNRNYNVPRPPFPGVHRQVFVHFLCLGRAVCVFSGKRGSRGFNFCPS